MAQTVVIEVVDSATLKYGIQHLTMYHQKKSAQRLKEWTMRVKLAALIARQLYHVKGLFFVNFIEQDIAKGVHANLNILIVPKTTAETQNASSVIQILGYKPSETRSLVDLHSVKQESDSYSIISDLSDLNSISSFSSSIGGELCELGESCSDWNCRSNHPSNRKGRCKFGRNCINYFCVFIHPVERSVKCMKECVDFHCKKLHPRDRCNVCKYGGECFKQDCKYLHPTGRDWCNKDCIDISCDKIHPLQRRRICEFGQQCFNTKCYALHPSSRPMVCPNVNCIRYACHLLHRKGRPNLCKSKHNCRNKDCVYLHPDEDCPF
eukprot:gene14399-30659_t